MAALRLLPSNIPIGCVSWVRISAGVLFLEQRRQARPCRSRRLRPQLPSSSQAHWKDSRRFRSTSIDVILVPETDDWVNPLGVKGLGELGNVGVNAAVANAVYRATGVRVRDLPIRLEKLLSA
jgi:hypothetical protein